MLRIRRLLDRIAQGDASALAGVDANAQDEGGRSILMHAVLADGDDPAVVKALLAHGADPDVAEPPQDWTPLHAAARDQKEAKVRALLDAGAEVDPVDSFGNTPLWRSVSQSTPQQYAVARALVEHGADPQRKNGTDVSPLDIARRANDEKLVALLERRGAEDTD